MLNQHRLQPWAYQSAIYAIVFAAMDRETARRWLVPLAASVYLYSGLGKLDYQFAHTVGQNFLSAVDLPVIGNLADRFEHNTLAIIALLLPLSEALIAIGLLFHRTRRVAAVCVILLHLSLVVMLGPWNLDHSNGVLFWNVLLIIQAWFLFLKPIAEPCKTSPPQSEAKYAAVTESIGKRLAAAIVILAIVMPATERWGYWDHWTSWALYSPHSSRVEVQIHRSAMDQLPATIHPFLQDDNSDGWHHLQMNLWSLDRLNVPIYPQARFQLAVASRIAHLYDLSDSVRVIVKGVADRRSGVRNEQRAIGRKEIDAELRHYWIAQ
ncbi:putative membrane protein [Rhodopirellula maiorica SM1]|uniref:Putative membrane protein n=2 Tax=Novipirellula TaxID=2795426 RepID=M5RCW5_9BACT|nr:putative membrane protein [Rhodopirellula maiorica SM1]